MNRKRNLVISTGALLLAGLLVYGVYLLQIRQVELQQTVGVVVPKEFIKAGTLLTEDMLEVMPMVKGAYREQMAVRVEDLVGQENLVPLGGKEPVLLWKLDRFHLMPREGQATFQIPKDYILSLSGGIRAGDQVRLYLSGKEGAIRLFPHDITVASVKSAANVEVDDSKQSAMTSRFSGDAEKMYASRREANGAIDQINLNLTEEEWIRIDEACRSKQSKLVIAFSSASLPLPPKGVEP
ncbi:SAF domain-containing protein [Paenibacillus sp. CC-CFT747]|nr:SAF domain-containing protein [Paenibacillus sp. CC-CFT747]